MAFREQLGVEMLSWDPSGDMGGRWGATLGQKLGQKLWLELGQKLWPELGQKMGEKLGQKLGQKPMEVMADPSPAGLLWQPQQQWVELDSHLGQLAEVLWKPQGLAGRWWKLPQSWQPGPAQHSTTY